MINNVVQRVFGHSISNCPTQSARSSLPDSEMQTDGKSPSRTKCGDLRGGSWHGFRSEGDRNRGGNCRNLRRNEHFHAHLGLCHWTLAFRVATKYERPPLATEAFSTKVLEFF